jgi:hypothetical protein
VGLIWRVRGGRGSPEREGSTAAQTERRGATVVEQRSSRGRRQGGRGSSRRRCEAWDADRVFREGPEWRSAMAQRRQAQRCSCVEAEEEEERSCSTEVLLL